MNSLQLSMWSGPRNLSTAIMYSFAQRVDTRVVDEPLYGHYLRVSGANHPGAEEVMAVMDCDGERVAQNIIVGATGKPIIFFKNMAHHLVNLEWDFLKQTTNILLTRDPYDMLPSLAKNITPTLKDTGYDIQVEILDFLTELGQSPPILDSRELLKNPRAVLGQLCNQLGIPFDERMLSWPAKPRLEDGIWAKYWYHGVHHSTGFAPYKSKVITFPENLQSLLEICRPYYERLSQHAIKA